MSFYDNDGAWPATGRQPSWDRQQPQSRSGASSAVSQQQQQHDSNAFASQFEEIARANDNLMKSGKFFPGPASPGVMAGRRDSLPQMGRGYDYANDPRTPASSSSRHPSVTEFETGRPGSAGLQGYYQGQRFPAGGRQSEAEQMIQAKRRMAAQRERELRNYHQEQQYNRKTSGVKSDRSMSPTTMSEEDRRELIARQHRALYGDNSQLYGAGEGSTQRPPSQDTRGPPPPTGQQRASPLAFDAFGMPPHSGAAEGAVQMPPRERATNTASPSSSQNPPQQPFQGLVADAHQQSSRTSNSSPGGSPPLGQGQKGGASSGVAPIGTRPMQGSMSAGGLNKRSTTPLTPSSLSYGFSADNGQQGGNNGSGSSSSANNTKDERSTSASSNPPHSNDKGVSGLGGWPTTGGVWGSSKNTLAVQPSVWG